MRSGGLQFVFFWLHKEALESLGSFSKEISSWEHSLSKLVCTYLMGTKRRFVDICGADTPSLLLGLDGDKMKATESLMLGSYARKLKSQVKMKDVVILLCFLLFLDEEA